MDKGEDIEHELGGTHSKTKRLRGFARQKSLVKLKSTESPHPLKLNSITMLICDRFVAQPLSSNMSTSPARVL